MMIYVVKSGDTINTIARNYGTSPDEIALINGLENPDALVIGQSIYISDNITEKYYNLQINGYAYSFIKKDVLENTFKYLTFVTFFTYGFTEEGKLIEPQTEENLQTVKESNVKPIMLISTLTSEGGFSNELANKILNDEYSQDILIENIVNNIEEKGYYGLDIDFEFILPEDKENYSGFVRKAKEKLSEKGYILIVSLAPKTSSDQKGLLYEAHDYYAIGQIADYVLIMTYEWGYTYGPPMAVAPINKVIEVLNYAVSEIEREKIFMGVPNYGYDWRMPYIRGETKAQSISNTEAINRAVRYNAEIMFDELAMSPYYEYTDEEGNGHIVWFEDARSIEAKTGLVYRYGFTGISIWNIMNLFTQGYNLIYDSFNVVKKI
ncbi:MAG: LysM peptidoglycan-binding domain-containing protein [Firmicutes bacterium]|nr:LysM peptidoglycan-binding domain-containing protein [Bacillota bacterium]